MSKCHLNSFIPLRNNEQTSLRRDEQISLRWIIHDRIRDANWWYRWYVLFVIVSGGCWSIVRAWKPRSRRKWVTAPLAITRWQHPSNGASLVNARSSCRVSSFAHGFLIFARKSVIFTGNAGYASAAAWYSVLQISPSRSRGWNKLDVSLWILPAAWNYCLFSSS